MSDDDFTHVEDLTPDDAVPIWSMRMVVYLQGDEEMCETEYMGPCRLRDVLGHIEAEKWRLVARQYEVPMVD